MSDGILIIGGGLAAARAVKSYREEGGTDPIRLLTSDSAYPYFRPPLSKRYMRGEIEADDTLVEAPAFYDAARLHGRARDDRRLGPRPRCRARHRAIVVPFERLVLASGTSPRQLEVAGRRPRRRLHAADARRRDSDPRARGAVATRALVIGPNFIGLETTASLTQRGRRGHARRAAATSCSRRSRCPPSRGSSTSSTASTASSSSTRTRSPRSRGEDGRIAVRRRRRAARSARPTCSSPASASRRTPRFLDGAGLEIDDGVLVNERFESSRPDVWAIGDVARFFDPVYGHHRRIEHASNASYQGAELGKVLAGKRGGLRHGVGCSSPRCSEQASASSAITRVTTRSSSTETSTTGTRSTLHTAGGRIVAALTMGQEDDVLERMKELIRAKAPAGEFALVASS